LLKPKIIYKFIKEILKAQPSMFVRITTTDSLRGVVSNKDNWEVQLNF
jgi:hypothetical protein